jgi:hypothetical protein
MANLDTLSNEILMRIFSLTDLQTVNSIKKACHRFRDIIKSPFFKKQVFRTLVKPDRTIEMAFDKKHGKSVITTELGTMYAQFENDRPIGTWVNKNKEVESEYHYDNDGTCKKIVETNLGENYVCKCEYNNTVRHGSFEIYEKTSETVLCSGQYTNNFMTGYWEFYRRPSVPNEPFESRLRMKGTVVKSVKHNQWIYHYEEYDVIAYYNLGARVGTWSIEYDDGETRQVNWFDGIDYLHEDDRRGNVLNFM